MRTWTYGVLLCSTLLAWRPSCAVTYTVSDLGTLGGSQSLAWDINDSGQIVGESTTADGETHAFLYTGGTMTDLAALPFGDPGVRSRTSSARAINASGQLVGWATRAGPDL